MMYFEVQDNTKLLKEKNHKGSLHFKLYSVISIFDSLIQLNLEYDLE